MNFIITVAADAIIASICRRNLRRLNRFRSVIRSFAQLSHSTRPSIAVVGAYVGLSVWMVAIPFKRFTRIHSNSATKIHVSSVGLSTRLNGMAFKIIEYCFGAFYFIFFYFSIRVKLLSLRCQCCRRCRQGCWKFVTESRTYSCLSFSFWFLDLMGSCFTHLCIAFEARSTTFRNFVRENRFAECIAFRSWTKTTCGQECYIRSVFRLSLIWPPLPFSRDVVSLKHVDILKMVRSFRYVKR